MKRTLGILILSTVLSLVSWAQEDIPPTCTEKAEMSYAYNVELLMHAYETATVSPRDFEKLRTQLVERRETDLQGCSGVAYQEEDTFPQMQNTYGDGSQETPHSRSIASVPVPIAHQQQLAPAYGVHRRGVFTEVVPQPGEEGEALVDQDGTPIYTGERISIGN